MDLKEAHDFIRYILEKERGGWVAPEEIDENLHRAQWEKFNEDYGAYAFNQNAKDALSPFSTKMQFTSANGIVSFPTTVGTIPFYEHLLSMYVQYYDNIAQKIRYKSIKLLDEAQIAQRLDSQILAPLVTDPVGEQIGVGVFQLYPATNLAGYAYYLRQPIKPQFVYTFGTDGREIIYNQSASTQMEWNLSSMNKILLKAIQLAGVNLNDEQIVQYTAAKDQQP